MEKNAVFQSIFVLSFFLFFILVIRKESNNNGEISYRP